MSLKISVTEADEAEERFEFRTDNARLLVSETMDWADVAAASAEEDAQIKARTDPTVTADTVFTPS